MTQEQAILNYLETHGSIDPLTALKEFGCFRLGARICDLRKQGHNIVTETKTRQTENGKKVWAEYHMKKPLPGVATGERQGVGTIGVDSTSEDITSSAVKLADKLRVLRFYGEPEIVDFCKRTEDNGLVLSWHGEKGKYTVTAVSALLKIYRDFGINKNRYEEFVRVVRDSWNGDPDSLRSQILWGVALFVKEYWGMFEPSRLVKRLSSARPIDIIRDAAVDRSSGNRKYGVQVLQVYNFGLGNKLPNLL